MAGSISLKIGVSGVRGIVGESLTPQLVCQFAAAFGTYTGAGPVVVGSDTRPSREMVKQAVCAGLLSVGCRPVDLGVVPTPTVQHHLLKVGAVGGICVTASHNPIQWNALKFFGPDGIILRQNQAAELTDLYHQGVYPRVPGPETGRIARDETAIERHLATILAAVDVERIRARRLKVAIDCCNGAAWAATPRFLEALGCAVVGLGLEGDQPFPRNPEPVPENLGELCALIRREGADIGFAQDADADRLAVVDQAGEPLGEECTLALAARHVLARTPGPVVANVSTSRMIDDVAAEFGCPVRRTRVGEVNVVEEILRRQAPLGGEGNGGVIVPSLNPCRDSFVAMALILEALAAFDGSIRQLREQIPSYAMLKRALPCGPRDVGPALRRLRRAYATEPLDLLDGVTIRWPDRWVQARPSNTEPIIRVTAEAPTREQAAAMVQEAAEYLLGG